MIDRSYYAQVENDIRSNMAIVIQVLQPYARSTGGFNDWNDLRTAIKIAEFALLKASLAASFRLPPKA